MRRAVLLVALAVGLTITATDASAQWGPPPPPPMHPPETPPGELGVTLGVWQLQHLAYGGRLTRNLSDWFAWEAGVDGRGTDEFPAYLLMVANTRFLARGPRDDSYFVTLGVGSGLGTGWAVSPMVGMGIQKGWTTPATVRVEVQHFTRGRAFGGRLMISLAIAIPE